MKDENNLCAYVKECSRQGYGKSKSIMLFMATQMAMTRGKIVPEGGLLTTGRQMKRCLYMYNLINSDNRNNMIIRGSDHHSHNTRSKDTVRNIKSDTNWGLLRSLNSALLDWNPLPMEMRNLSYNAFGVSLHNRFKF